MSSRSQKIRKKIWQILPAVCGSMMCLPYGIMLGWPSPMYPKLLAAASPVPITKEITAPIAACLMIGNTVTTPLSACRRFDPKYGMVLGLVVMIFGWILLWQSKSVYWLMGSRVVIGAGNGLGMGQLKFYISEICEDSLAPFMTKLLNLYVFFGVVLAYSYGPFVNFRYFSVITAVLGTLILMLVFFLPSTPRELVKRGKRDEAKKMIAFLKPHLDVDEEVAKIHEKLTTGDNYMNLLELVRREDLRRNLIVLAFLVVFQQLSGVPATIVYSQIIFEESRCPRPELCSLVYATVYFLTNIYGIFFVPLKNKKYFFLFSSVGVSLLLVVQIVVLVENLNVIFWNLTSLVVLVLYIFVYALGLGNVPVSMIPDFFPEEAHLVVASLFIMLHSLMGIAITKIFQTLYTGLGVYAPFCFCLTVSTFSIVFVIIFVPNKKSK